MKGNESIIGHKTIFDCSHVLMDKELSPGTFMQNIKLSQTQAEAGKRDFILEIYLD